MRRNSNGRSAVTAFADFDHILREARKQGYSFEVARGVYKKRFGEECPFHEKEPYAAPSLSCDLSDVPLRQDNQRTQEPQFGLPQLRESQAVSSPTRAHKPRPETTEALGIEVARDQAAVPGPISQVVPPLRRSGHNSPPEVPKIHCVHGLHQDAKGVVIPHAVHRPEGQQSRVRAGQPPVRHTEAERKEPSPIQAGAQPPKICTVDFETRSACDLRACGSAVYAEHPTTDILCLAYRLDGIALWTPIDGGCPDVLVAHILSGGIVEAHNCAFEEDIYGFPPVPPRQWRDSMATCAAMAIPLSLEKAGAAMHAAEQKDPGGKAVMMKLSQPRKPTKKDARTWFDDPEMFAQLYAYCRQDVAAEHCLSEMMPPLNPHEQDIWHASNAINRRGIAVDLPAVKAALRMIALAEADYHQAIHDATGGVINADTIGSWQVVVPWCAGRGVRLPNYQKGTLAEVVKQDIPADVKVVLNARLALGRTSTAKYQALVDRTSSDGRLRNHLVYHGAGPGRWAGRGVQLQNLPRGGLKVEAVHDALADMATMSKDDFGVFWGDPMATASQCLRGCLIAGQGADRRRLQRHRGARVQLARRAERRRGRLPRLRRRHGP